MKLTSALLPVLTIAFSAVAQNDSIPVLNQSPETLNLTEVAELARSLTWYHLDENDEQELCGSTEATPEGKADIYKQDCQDLIDFLKSRPGYWKVNGYNSKFGLADLVTRGTCEFTVTREDALTTYFEIGNLDVVNFVEAAMRASKDPMYLATSSGSVTCPGDFTPLVKWRVDCPMSYALPSVRMSTAGWGNGEFVNARLHIHVDVASLREGVRSLKGSPQITSRTAMPKLELVAVEITE